MNSQMIHYISLPNLRLLMVYRQNSLAHLLFLFSVFFHPFLLTYGLFWISYIDSHSTSLLCVFRKKNVYVVIVSNTDFKNYYFRKMELKRMAGCYFVVQFLNIFIVCLKFSQRWEINHTNAYLWIVYILPKKAFDKIMNMACTLSYKNDIWNILEKWQWTHNM